MLVRLEYIVISEYALYRSLTFLCGRGEVGLSTMSSFEVAPPTALSSDTVLSVHLTQCSLLSEVSPKMSKENTLLNLTCHYSNQLIVWMFMHMMYLWQL